MGDDCIKESNTLQINQSRLIGLITAWLPLWNYDADEECLETRPGYACSGRNAESELAWYATPLIDSVIISDIFYWSFNCFSIEYIYNEVCVLLTHLPNPRKWVVECYVGSISNQSTHTSLFSTTRTGVECNILSTL